MPPTTPAQTAQRWRATVSFMLLALSILCLITGSLFVWMRATAYSPDGYVASALQVQGQVQIKTALANYITADVLPPATINSLADQTADQLPIPDDRRDLAASLLAAGLQSQVQNVANRVVDAVSGTSLAASVTQRASQEVVALLRNEPGVFRFEGDAVVFDIEPLVIEARATLEDELGTLAAYLPPPRTDGYPTYTVVQGNVVTMVQRAIMIIDLMSWLLPVLFVVLIALGLLVARERRSAAFRTMIAIAVSAVVVVLGIRIAGAAIAGLAEGPAAEGVVSAILEAASTRLVDQTLWMALLAAVVGVVLWLLGPDRLAHRGRAWLAARGRDLVSGVPGRAGRVTDVARRYRVPLLVGAFALGIVILAVVTDAGTSGWVLALMCYLVLALLVEYAACAGWMQAIVRWVRSRRRTPAA